MGWTECALRSVSAETSDRPKCLIFPWLQHFEVRYHLIVLTCRLNLLLQLHHGFNSLFNGRNPIHLMAVVNVNCVHPESLEALLTCNLHVLGISSKCILSIRLVQEPKFGSQENIISLGRSLKPFTHDILTVSVNVGHVPKTQSSSMCMLQKCNFLVKCSSWAIESAEASETETDSSDLGAISAQGSQGKRHY